MRSPHLLAAGCVTDNPDAAYRAAEAAVWDEVAQSLIDYPRAWTSPEEGAMVLFEEIDELWDEVRRNHIGLARREAAQVGAMAVRFIADICGPRSAQSSKRLCRAGAARQRDLRHAGIGPARAFNSSHEAAGFLRRAYDALWAAVCSDADTAQLGELAARVAALAVRFITEITTDAPIVRAVR